MPSPTPVLLTSIPSLSYQLDCIRKEDPTIQAPLDEQRYETFPVSQPGGGSLEDGVQMDAKLLWQPKFPPYRIISIGEFDSFHGGPVPLEQALAEFNSSAKYWNAVPWGSMSGFLNTRNGISFPPGFIDFGKGWQLFPSFPGVGTGGEYLAAWTVWSQSSDAFFPASYSRIARMFQVICPDIWAPHNYDIWQVTGRWSVRLTSNIPVYGDDGYPGHFPIPAPPWALSTDFLKVSSGTLKPGEVLTVGMHDLDPVNGGCQSPPAPSNRSPGTNWGVGGYSDWDGWAVGTYIVFTS